MSVVDEVKAQLDLVDIVSQTVKLRRTGKNYIGFCPFHSNTHTPAFVVFPESQTWRCFGQCNEGGDIFSYVMKREGWDFNEALRFLAEKAGVTLVPYSPVNEQSASLKENLSRVLESAQQFYRQQMLETKPGQDALAYLHKRGLTDETIMIWGLGFAPAGWNDLSIHLKRKGYDDSLILQAGLLTERESGETYDKFRNRLMFPIRDAYGKMAGFGGRVLDPDDAPKYMNSPRTDLFDKGRMLFGLDLARQTIRKEEQAVIVEGYMDVIGLHQAGFHSAVSPMGTALTEDQFKLLKKYSRNIVLALDPDAAGEKATLRGLETVRKSMDQDAEMRFDAHGLLHVEGRLKADIRVTTLPEGKDPDEIVLSDPQAWQKILAEAKPVVVHVMETLAASQDINDAKVKREIAGQVLPLIEDVADPVEREAYRQQLARLLRVDERVLVVSSPIPRKTRRSKASQSPEMGGINGKTARISDTAQRNRILEQHALQQLIKDPESLYRINRTLAILELPQLSEKDFSESDFVIGFKLVKAALEQDEMSPQDYVAENLPEVLEESETPVLIEKSLPPSDEKRMADQVRNILRIRRNLIEARIQEILYLQSEMEEKTYTEEEAQFLLLEQLNQRRLVDVALQSPQVGGSSPKGQLVNRRKVKDKRNYE